MSGTKSLVEIHAAVLLFGLAGLFGKWLALPSNIIVLGRVFFASLALAFFVRHPGRWPGLRPTKAPLTFCLLGYLLTVHWVAFFRAIQVSSVAVGLFSYSSFPVFTVFLEPLFHRERLKLSNLGLAMACLFGVFFIVPHFRLSDSTFQGVLWGLLSGLAFSFLSILNRGLSQKYPAFTIAFFQDLAAFFFLLPFYIVKRPILKTTDILLLAGLGVFCTAGSHTLFIKGLRMIKAQTAALISSLEPVYGTLFALILLGETPSLRTILGGGIILGTTLFVSIRLGRPSALARTSPERSQNPIRFS
jgi:drug/metabolite transporter (DMT)-like permease